MRVKELDAVGICQGTGRLKLRFFGAEAQLAVLKRLSHEELLSIRFLDLKTYAKDENRLREVPEQILSMACLEELDLFGNLIVSVPVKLASLTKLMKVDVGSNPVVDGLVLSSHTLSPQALVKHTSLRMFGGAQRAALCFITIWMFRSSMLDMFPKDVVVFIAKKIWKSRCDSRWKIANMSAYEKVFPVSLSAVKVDGVDDHWDTLISSLSWDL